MTASLCEIATGRISNCHCEEEHRSDVAISTLTIAPLVITINIEKDPLIYRRSVRLCSAVYALVLTAE